MLTPKRLLEMAKRWRNATSNSCGSRLASKGHFVVYTVDGKRFVIPILYLNNNIFKELFKLSEDEFGFPSNGPITIPCDAVFMEYVISLLRRRTSSDVERTVLNSIITRRCPESFLH